MLAAAGNCARPAGRGSPAKELQDGRAARQRPRGPAPCTSAPTQSTRRSVYLPLLRGVTPRSLRGVRPREQRLVTGSRDTTTVPTQALYLLNSVRPPQALALGETLIALPRRARPQAKIRPRVPAHPRPCAETPRRSGGPCASWREFRAEYRKLRAVKPAPAAAALTSQTAEARQRGPPHSGRSRRRRTRPRRRS